MKFALFLVLSLSAMALAGPAYNKDNQIQSQDAAAYKQQQQQYMTEAKGPAIDILKQWCFSSQMSQQELTASFKKLVQVIKSNPNDKNTEAAVMNERICQGAKSQQQQQQSQQQQQQEQQKKQQQQQKTGDEAYYTGSANQADAQAHELIKDVYMDALISANSRECTQQLLQIVQSQKVDSIRAAYYMTRIAVTDKQSIKDAEEIKQFAENFVEQQQQQKQGQNQQQQQSEAIERQKLFATTALIGKWISQKPSERQQITEVAKEVAKTIVERYIKPVSQQEVEQYKQGGQQSQELAKKIAKRNAALKALANIPGHVLKECQVTEQALTQLAQNKQELNTVRQSAIECFEQNDKQMQLLKQLTFDQEEPIEVRVAAYRALMTTAYAANDNKQQQQKQQQAQEIVEQVVKHCESEENQQQDDQFVLYAISHLDNVRTSQQPEHQAIKATIAANKQHYMQIQVLAKKFKQQLNDVRRSSRNYKLEQEFNQLESGLVLEGDLIYESKQKQQQQQQGNNRQQQQQQQAQILPKLVRVNMSMPIMGETVNVVEITLRQNQMDEEILSALKMVQSAKFNSQSVSKVVDSFKSTVERQQQQQQQKQQQQQQQQQNQQYKNQNQEEEQEQQQVEADLTIKVDGCTIVYLCVDDFKTDHNQQQQQQHQRNTRSIHSSNSIVDEAIEYLKRQPVAFNRGFNVNINERLAKVLDVDANILAGLRFESRAQGHSQEDFEIVAQMEPRFSFEAVVGPAKMSSKKLLQRLSTKTALGLRLRFKKDQLIDVQVDLPMNTMELFTVETQLVERSDKTTWSYNYLPESIYGQEDIYSAYASSDFSGKLVKRSIAGFGTKKSTISQLYQGKGVSHSYETSPKMARATGLNAKLRVAASPKDMSFLASAVVEKYEQEMQGYRVKVEKSGGRTSADQETYMVTLSTPGSRTDRTMQMRLTTQAGQQRSLVKAEIQSARQQAAFVAELVHDGRQYSIKSELASRAGKQWRHAAEFGFVQTQQSGGRLSSGFSYKPYAQIESTSMKRPVQLQGQIAYTQSPKSVISYELKCPASGSFVQGKLIFDQRDSKPMGMKTMRNRRSMQSPIEMIVSKDLTLTNEFIAQINKHAVKVHNMLDWDCQKYSLQGDSYATYKNMRQSGASEQQLSASMKVDQEQQSFTVERKCPQDERKQFVARLSSKVRPTGHQMEAECRYNGRRQSLVAYKHKVDVQEVANNKYEAQVELELVDTERQIAEKAQGRVRINTERKMKQVQAEVASPSRQMSAKFTADYQSAQQHQLQLQVQSAKFQHKTELRNTQRQFAVQSRTEQPATGKVYYKMQVDAQKQAPVECKIVVEAPQKRVALAADLKLASGKRSSLAIQGGRFASSVEFSFDDSQSNQSDSTRYGPFQRAANFRLRSNLKDLVNKQAYWMDSQLNGATFDKDASFVRLDSPYYRTDIEYDPRVQETKVNAYGRTKRSTDQFNSIYSSPMIESLISQASDKLQLGPSKLWMLRSIVSSPYGREQLKQKARRALFEYADRRQAHKHAFDWNPQDEQVIIDWSRQPNTEFDSTTANTVEPIRMKAALSTRGSRPSSAMLESPWMSAEMEAKPFFECDDEDEYQQNKNTNNQNKDDEVYAKITALSRHPRSAFKKHESEIRYKREQGYKAHMKHQDSQDKRHELRAETASNPKSWSRVAYESDKHGKTNWEHKWRQQQKKRSTDQEDVYANEFSLKSEGPAGNKWQHETSFQFEEPTRMASSRRHRRSISFYNKDDQDNTFAAYPMEYLKHTSARLSSKQSFANKKYNSNQDDNKYQLDFDYQPQANYASLNMDMPQGMKHASSVEIKPSERLYKIQSRLYNRHTNQPSYELLASTKPYVSDLATANQEPVFVHSSHPMLERPIDTKSLAYKLFKQPLKLDYSDKYGRQASFDYDHMQEAAESTSTSGRRIAGLRQKRAAVYYKDGSDFEHSASYDFYPEALLAKAKPSFYAATSGQMMPVAIKTNTKYGPIVVRAESNSDNTRLDMESPLMSAKFAAETTANGQRQLYTVQIDNKQQRVQLAKLVRDYAPETVRSSKMVKKFVRDFDNKRFEHQAEVLASIADQIFKIKAQTKEDGRPELTIEAEYNQQTEKAYAKINGERVNGQAVVDLARNTAELQLDAEAGKHGNLHHVTRLVQTSDKYYSLESMTSREGRPVYKLTGRVSAKMFEPEHLFSRRHQSSRGSHADHQSTFEAVIYEPKEIHVNGEFNCETKEGRVVFHDADEKKTQETKIRYDDETDTLYASAQLSSQREGQIYAAKAKLNLPGLFQADECMRYGQQQTCKSEIVYSDNKTQGVYAVQYYPGEQVTANTPFGKYTMNLAY